MRSYPKRILILSAMALATLILPAQGWDAATQAQGWARQDKDDTFTFYDPPTKALHNWIQGGGDMVVIPLNRLDGRPSRWVLTPRNTAWVVTGTTLTLIDSNGRIVRDTSLPAEVASLCWDTKGFVLSYKTQEPYLEKRRYTDGDVVWTFGAKPGNKESLAVRNLHPILMDDLGHVLMASGTDLNLSILDGDTGKKLAESNLKLGDGPAPALAGGLVDRGPIRLWSGHALAFASLRADDLPPATRRDLQGQVLAKIDLVKSTVEILPTGLPMDHKLVGILEGNAVFVNPKGGLLLVAVQ